MTQKLNVFLSIGRAYNAAQQEFRTELEAALERLDCQEITLDPKQRTSLQPLAEAREKIRASDAIIVVAFRRLHFESVVEFPDSELAKERKNQSLPTPWNSIEAAMGYGYGLPMLMIIEEGLHQEAIVKDRHEFAAQVVPITKDVLRSPEFLSPFEDFFRRVREEKAAGVAPVASNTSVLDPSQITLRRLLDLPIGVWVSIGAVLIALLAATFALGHRAGDIFWPDAKSAPVGQEPAPNDT